MRENDITTTRRKSVRNPGHIIALTDALPAEIKEIAWEIIQVPTTNHLLLPLLLPIPFQFLTYHIAALGDDGSTCRTPST